MRKSASWNRARLVVAADTRQRLLPVEPDGAAEDVVAPHGIAVEVSTLTPPIVEGRPHWPPVAVAAWLRAARALGVDATDRTYEHIDSRRDGDDCYAGTVQVGQQVLDLVVDPTGVLRAVTDNRYLI